MRSARLWAFVLAAGIGLPAAVLAFCTMAGMKPMSNAPADLPQATHKVQLLDRHGEPLTQTYRNPWNYNDTVALHQIPSLLQAAFVMAEDKRFFSHPGMDLWARLNALWQNLGALRVVRGASTISEQVVRLIHPRPRTVWSRWLEGFEAMRLERRWRKAAILEFYLNQVPFGAQRRGVVQAARYYFDRDLSTLSPKEMLALAVLVRAPSSLDLYRHPEALLPAVTRLSERMTAGSLLSNDQLKALAEEKLSLSRPRLRANAAHFARHLFDSAPPERLHDTSGLHTTLDAGLQQMVQQTLDRRLRDLADRRVFDAAALVVANQGRAILAWANAGQSDPAAPHREVDGVLARRQPGSALKPFLYALALERGWSAATRIDDAPLQTVVGPGLHTFHNYSHTYYGPVSLRNALGNSLNTPAVRTLRFVGVNDYLARLRALGLTSLDQTPDFYGEGLALGNGEISLFELTQAYATLACRGRFAPLQSFGDDARAVTEEPVFSEAVASLIADILSDPAARQLEFGTNSALNFPQQTAVKTGTSSDYRDAWAVGFNSHFTVGVWMGNLDASPTNGVSGAMGPALVLRTIFARINTHEKTRPLFRSPQLVRQEFPHAGSASRAAPVARREEWFVAGSGLNQSAPKPEAA
ncbi:MAG: transglycosylase domain-containing protein, partial [Desulfatitalea sp.]|nr:transglycosylase domain-containing protein [Desulfatitalea sp.]